MHKKASFPDSRERGKTYKLDKKRRRAIRYQEIRLWINHFYLTRTSPASHPRYQVALLSVSYVYSLCSASTPLRRGVQGRDLRGSASSKLS